jgi:hypothetical protein
MNSITYLYVKQHNQTGLKYFGLTRQDPERYKGSGIYWKRHLDKHGDDISTVQLWEFTDQAKCSEFADRFSRENNIVNSMEWANLINETGSWNLPIGQDVKLSTREKISAFRKQFRGWKHSDQTKGKMARARKTFHDNCLVEGRQWMEPAIAAARTKIECQYCSRNISRSNLERHESGCKHNPNSIPTKTKTCPICSKTVDFRNYARHHGMNCKLSSNEVSQ